MGILNDGPVVVTGAAGFIGSHVTAALLSAGARVAGLDNFDPFYARGDKQRNLEEASRGAAERFTFEEADICDAGAVRRLFERVRPAGVIHLAAKAGVRPSIADPAGYMRANVVGTSVILSEAHRAGCARVVAASSSSVYGNNAVVPFSEDQDVSRPISPYAASKRACELLAWTHHHLTGQPVACLRFFTVFGPRQRPDLAIAAFMRRIASGEPIRVFGDGSSSRDYTYIDDIVRGVLAAYERIGGHGYRVWNLGGSNPVTLSEMVAAVERTVGRRAVVGRAPAQPGDVERTHADLARSGAELGYAPVTPFEDGVRAQWAWVRGVDAPARRP